jgi:hypothetical protein
MRPTVHKQSALGSPFNTILGTESNVRVLRVLSSLGLPLPPAEVARRAALQPSGVRRTLRELVDMGIVEFVGVGARQHVQLRDAYPLTTAVRALFQAEAARVQVIHEGIAVAIQKSDLRPQAAWLEGSVATQTDQINDPLAVGVLATASEISSLVEQLREALAEVERAQDVTIDIQGWTLPDLQTVQRLAEVRLAEARPIYGPPPLTFLRSSGALESRKRRKAIVHGDLDARARALGIAVGNKLAQDPSIIPRTKARLVELLKDAAPHEQHVLREWIRVLDTTSLPRLRHLLADTGERGTRLRQSLPFLDLLTAEERAKAIADADADR